MRIGVMSDSHGRLQLIRDALKALDAAGVDVIVHCGDVGGVDALGELAGRRAWFVWGNTDFPEPSWRAEVEALGLPWPDGKTEFQVDGCKLAVFHGHERAFRDAVKSGRYNYIFYGHSHRTDDQRVGTTRVINPGALHRTSQPTVAVLDLSGDQLEFLPVERIDH